MRVMILLVQQGIASQNSRYGMFGKVIYTTIALGVLGLPPTKLQLYYSWISE